MRRLVGALQSETKAPTSRRTPKNEMQNHLLTILILLPVVGAATAVVYSLTPGARESHHRWIALGFTTL